MTDPGDPQQSHPHTLSGTDRDPALDAEVIRNLDVPIDDIDKIRGGGTCNKNGYSKVATV